MNDQTKIAENELLNCPFCGGKDLHIDSIMIACNFCVVPVPKHIWNTRHPITPTANTKEE